VAIRGVPQTLPAVLEVVFTARRLLNALRAFTALAEGGNKTAIQIRAQLAKARNWTIVLMGSLLIFVGSVVEAAAG
jgi:hypothetical protein